MANESNPANTATIGRNGNGNDDTTAANWNANASTRTSASMNTSGTKSASESTSTSSSTSAYKAVYNRHRRRPHEPNFLGDLDDVIDFSTYAYRYHDKPDERIIPLINPNNIDIVSDTDEESSTETNHDRDSKKHSSSGCESDKVAASARHTYKGPIYGIKSHSGFIYIPNALSLQLQHDLAHRALTEYCNAPHATNIDLVPAKVHEIINDELNDPSQSMWNLWKSQHGHGYGHGHVQSLHVDEVGDGDAHAKSISSGNDNGAANKRTRKEKPKPSKQISSPSQRYYRNFDKLSWATTGYHYDWTARAYKEDRKSIMPPAMEALGEIFAQLDQDHRPVIANAKSSSGGDSDSGNCIEKKMPQTATATATATVTARLDQQTEQEGKGQRHRFTASASIVNYYSLKSNMGGHRDDLELDFTQPVVSISLGLPAIFLLGGDTKNCEPIIPILVRPGDVYLLAGDSRLCYHGMARVITSDASKLLPALSMDETTKKELDSSSEKGTNSKRQSCGRLEDFQIHQWTDISEELSHEDRKRDTISSFEWEAIKTFLSLHRININVRQVLPHGIPSIPT